MASYAPLGEFLRSRRLASDPSLAPLPTKGVRRVPGLRREEIAQLAGVSPDYYARLEQGRQVAPSATVLASLAAALDLDAAERVHLYNLAHPSVTDRDSGTAARSAQPGLIRLMDAVGDSPAVLHGRGTDVLAVNEAARAVIADFYAKPAGDRNVARWFFLDESSRRFDDWDAVAGDVVGMLRLDVGRYPEDPRLRSLVDDMRTRSPLFAAFWEGQRVALDVPARKVIRHPTAGALTFDVVCVSPPSEADQTLFVFTMKSGSPTEKAVARLMAEWRSGGAVT
ncbi:helix-turn-helix transcriptional regulator [Streptomyces sp. NPDC057428]|uniref:helix-turn-helix transcriptional regulator n=1 Tax=Streptomyces sp. NPDC057428 TaxID=3346129 RepID=UPI003680F8FD